MSITGGAWAVQFRELEHVARRLRLVSRDEPEEELRDVELPDGEQRAALRREAARRVVTER
ncbi:MAG: hypothetical protein WD939_10345 [Dehalococcoidia bacterium]